MESFAKIYRLGGEVKEFEVSQYSTLEEAIKGVGIEVLDGDAVRINGTVTEDWSDYRVSNGDTIAIVPQVKGGC